MKLIKKPVGLKDTKGKYSEWHFKIGMGLLNQALKLKEKSNE